MSCSITPPLPVGGRCRLDENVKFACQPSVCGTWYCRLRCVIPATGVLATRLANASSELCSGRSICGFFSGTAFPNTRVSTPKIPDWELTANDALIVSRNRSEEHTSELQSPSY